MKAINAETKENRHEYDFKPGNASNPDASQPTRSAFTKCRVLSLLFRNRRKPRSELKQQCNALAINYKRTQFDMPVRWSSTDYMLMIFLYLKKAINSVLVI